MSTTDKLVAEIFEVYKTVHGCECPWKCIDFKSNSDLTFMLECLKLKLVTDEN